MAKLTRQSHVTFEQNSVESPSHYQGTRYEAIEIIQDYSLNFCLGNVLKYILRAGRKDPSKRLEDLQKAKRYIEYEIKAEMNKISQKT